MKSKKSPSGIALFAGLLLLASPVRAGEDFSTFIKGCDMSYTDQLQSASPVFTFENSVGTASDPFSLLVAHGVNYVRLRVWCFGANDTTPGYWCNEYETLKIAQQIYNQNGAWKANHSAAKALKIELDFMYSDTFVGGGSGYAGPAAWAADKTNKTALENDVTSFTKKVLQDMAAQGTPVDLVQVGNEINDGILWQSRTDSSSYYYDLIATGCAAVSAVDPSIGIVLHWAGTNSVSGNVSLIQTMTSKIGATAFDAIGISWYPWWNANQKIVNISAPSPNLGYFWGSNMGQFNKPLLVQETGYPWTFNSENGQAAKHGSSTIVENLNTYGANPSGARQYLIDMMTAVHGAHWGAGVFYWPTDAVTGWSTGGHGDFQAAMWDSVNEELKASQGGTTILSAFEN